MSSEADPHKFHPSISVNPREYFGLWTPQGWKTHRMRRLATRSESVTASGDGMTTVFSGFAENACAVVHDPDDPHSDGGIYPSGPRVEYPPGRARWAVSHTFLAYPHADQTLHGEEFTWSHPRGELATHFREHVALEEAITDPVDGLSVRVKNTPISRIVTGNYAYDLCNSAVRGVWLNEDKSGGNLYVRDRIRICHPVNAIYVTVGGPVVQVRGIWKFRHGDEAAFSGTGDCVDHDLLIRRGIPLDCPKLGMVGYATKLVDSRFYGGAVELIDSDFVEIDASWLAALQSCRDKPFGEQQVGYAGWKSWDHMTHIWGVAGYYAVNFDFNDNGIVDVEDEKTFKCAVGRAVRPNYYSAGYFGNDWLSAGVLLAPEMSDIAPVICYWQQGGGYDAESGEVRLTRSPGPGRRVFVEYFHDSPAAAGDGNILVHLRFPEA